MSESHGLKLTTQRKLLVAPGRFQVQQRHREAPSPPVEIPRTMVPGLGNLELSVLNRGSYSTAGITDYIVFNGDWGPGTPCGDSTTPLTVAAGTSSVVHNAPEEHLLAEGTFSLDRLYAGAFFAGPATLYQPLGAPCLCRRVY
jgi:hypothetical protein